MSNKYEVPQIPGGNAILRKNGLDWAVWLTFASAFVVYVEPAPTDLLFLFVLLFFVGSKLSSTLGIVPLLACLLIYNLGGFLSYMFFPSQPKALMFVVTSLYMAISGVVIACYVSENTVVRFAYITSGWIVGAVIASAWGFVDYFNLPSPFPLQVLPGRATGLFKDPNVFSTYLIFPTVYMMQTLVLRRAKHPILLSLAISFCTVAIFLAFSRGAWVNFVMATALMFLLTFLLSGERNLRMRILFYVVGGIIVASLLFMFLMSIPTIQSMFLQRFVLIQSYDGGETGRFGNQLRSLPNLLALPLGYGPLGFREIYGENPHNTFINAFSAYGWIGGISYLLLIVSSFVIGFKTIFTRTPWQPLAIAVFAPFSATILQGVQIDTEHWRHFYWMLGLMWGLFAATLHYRCPANGAVAVFQSLSHSKPAKH